MARSSRIGLGLLYVLILAGLAGCQTGNGWQALERETRVSHVDHLAGMGLRVSAGNGGVTVRREDRADVQITAELRAQTQDRLAEAKVVSQRDDAGVLEVYVDWPGGKAKNNEACSFELLLPDAAKIEVTTSNGGVSVQHVGDEAVLRTSNGKIHVQGVQGPVYGDTSNGQIHVMDVSGLVDVKTSNGRVEVINATGTIKAHSSNGAIHAMSVTEPFELRTSNGEITIALADTFAGEVELGTSNKGVSALGLDKVEVIDSGSKSMHLRFSGGDSKSTARTSNGKIRITQGD